MTHTEGCTEVMWTSGHKSYVLDHRLAGPFTDQEKQPTGKFWYMVWEPTFIKALMRLLKPGMVVYDIGAEEAEFSSLIGSVVGGSNVHLFEPTQGIWPNIKKIWEANSLDGPGGCWPGYVMAQSGAGYQEHIKKGWPSQVAGPIRLVTGFEHFREVEDIHTISIDNYAEATGTPPDVVIMDVEGAEAKVVEGMHRTLRKCHPYVFVSVHRYNYGYHESYDTQQEWMFRYFSQAGYVGRFLGADHESHWLFYHPDRAPQLARVPATWAGIDKVVKCMGRISDDEFNRTVSEQFPVTVLMCSSPISSHPSTAKIEESVRKIRAYPEMKRAEILILVDGVAETQQEYIPAYEEYKRRLVELCNWDKDFEGCHPVIFDKHTHQANMTRKALKLVRTPYIFFCGHDMWPMGSIPWEGLFKALEEKDVNWIRFMMHDKGVHPDWDNAGLYGSRLERAGIPLIPTVQWSQRPHLALTDWYIKCLDQYVRPDARVFIECVMLGVSEKPWNEYCLWVYAPSESRSGPGMQRCNTNNGREGVPQVEYFTGVEDYLDSSQMGEYRKYPTEFPDH